MGKFDDVNVSSLINDLSNILDDVNTRKHRLDFINESITSNIWSSESRNNFERGIISLKNKLGELEPILQNYLGIAGKIEQYKDIEFETEAKQMEYNSIETSREVCLVSYDDEGNPRIYQGFLCQGNDGYYACTNGGFQLILPGASPAAVPSPFLLFSSPDKGRC